MIRDALKLLARKSSAIHRLLYIYGYGTRVPVGLVLLNWLTQRIFGVNRNCSYSVHYTSTVRSPEKLILEEPGIGTIQSLMVSGGCYIQAGHGITVGNGTIWSSNVVIISANHDMSREDKGWVSEPTPVVIGRDCWIGANAIILPGVSLGDRTVVGAGAVVTRSFPDGYITLVGNPARPLPQGRALNATAVSAPP
jgi:acetyltransferase-like isoleucine patch superfamily enzyme